MESHSLYKMYTAQLQRELCVENLLFYQSVVEFELMPEHKMNGEKALATVCAKMLEIFECYIERGAPNEVRLEMELK